MYIYMHLTYTLFKQAGYRVTSIKIDPYLNVDDIHTYM